MIYYREWQVKISNGVGLFKIRVTSAMVFTKLIVNTNLKKQSAQDIFWECMVEFRNEFQVGTGMSKGFGPNTLIRGIGYECYSGEKIVFSTFHYTYDYS